MNVKISTWITRLLQENEKVTNEEKAKKASLKKWKVSQSYLNKLRELNDLNCGFCSLAFHRQDLTNHRKHACSYCPQPIQEYCRPLLENINTKWAVLADLIQETIGFIERFEPEGEEEQ